MGDDKTVVLAGGSGDLGLRIAKELVGRGARVRALVRKGSQNPGIQSLQDLGVELARVDFERFPELQAACTGGAVVVSVLSGLRDVIVQAQTLLLDAALAAGVKRFIPSDFAIDFDRVAEGKNRNFDLRREFKRRLDAAPIAATSILNGCFAEILTKEAPIVVPPIRRVVVWGDLNPKMAFTTKDNVAAFTAAAALDSSTPRTLRIAGSQVTPQELAQLATEISGKRFKTFRAGSLERFEQLIAVTRKLDLHERDTFSPWQGMQYTRDMFAGHASLEPLDNDRYPDLRWTSVKEVLAGDPRLAPAAGSPERIATAAHSH